MSQAQGGEPLLAATRTIQSDHPAVIEYARKAAGDTASPLDKALRLYYAVRDDVRYDPYRVELSAEGLAASTTLAHGYGWCVPKAALLAACCRSLGIPARVGYADVRNHLSTARMRESMGTDVFYWHGYTSIWLEERWVKATPAFNLSLCERFGLEPLEFDGRSDSLFHAFDAEGRQHMEYLRDRGEFDDVPVDAIEATLREAYPQWFAAAEAGANADADFDRDVEAETN